MPKNASESITIQLRCPRMPLEFGTNHAQFSNPGIRGQSFEQLTVPIS